MKLAIAAILVMASAVSTVAFAQDGTAHGPPKVLAPIVGVPRMPVPTPASPTGTVQKFFQPASELASIVK